MSALISRGPLPVQITLVCRAMVSCSAWKTRKSLLREKFHRIDQVRCAIFVLASRQAIASRDVTMALPPVLQCFVPDSRAGATDISQVYR